MSEKAAGFLRRTLDKLASSTTEIEAEELQGDVVKAGCTPIDAAADRDTVTVAGTLRTVTLRPRGGVPALEAELYDGSGTVTLVWLGRRRIAGIEPGGSLLASGRVCTTDGQRVIFNPRYELRG